MGTTKVLNGQANETFIRVRKYYDKGGWSL